MFLSVIMLCSATAISHNPETCHALTDFVLHETQAECVASTYEAIQNPDFLKFLYVNGVKEYEFKDYQCVDFNGKRI